MNAGIIINIQLPCSKFPKNNIHDQTCEVSKQYVSVFDTVYTGIFDKDMGQRIQLWYQISLKMLTFLKKKIATNHFFHEKDVDNLKRQILSQLCCTLTLGCRFFVFVCLLFKIFVCFLILTKQKRKQPYITFVSLNGWQLAKMKKSIPDMSLPWNL